MTTEQNKGLENLDLPTHKNHYFFTLPFGSNSNVVRFSTLGCSRMKW